MPVNCERPVPTEQSGNNAKKIVENNNYVISVHYGRT